MKDHSALEKILAPGGITPLYQPLYLVNSSECRLYGFECLSRGPAGTNFEPASVMFDYVRLKREEAVVDRACIAAAFSNVAALPPDVQLGVNVHASTLARDHGFVEFMLATAASRGLATNRITVEIVEHAPPWDNVTFLSVLTQLRKAGVRIALDDVGLGQSNFKMILDVCPDFLKLDRYFVDGCENDPKRQSVIAVVAQLAQRFDARVVAEGVENIDTINVLRSFDVELMQGFLFSQPLPIGEIAAFVQTVPSDLASARTWMSQQAS
jgi:EAL domain-containing protein (putative c-di-GMP-specific phosphodiesterase class I)